MIRARFLVGQDLGASARNAMRQAAQGAGLVLLSDAPGRLVAVTPGTPALALGQDGLLLGTLFAPGGRRSLEALSPAASATILDSGGQHLIQAYWGDYVAILPHASDVMLLRAPFGALPCLHVADGTAFVAASDIDTLRLGLHSAAKFSLDYAAIARQLIAGDLRRNETCLAGVDELRGGDRLTIANGRVMRDRLWSPWTFTDPRRRIDDMEDADRRLRDAAISCVVVRTGSSARPLLLLSGGLDSSIVAACLTAAGRDFACLNLMTANAAGDERSYARAVAARIGRPLAECDMTAGFPDIQRLAAVRLPRPVARSFEQHVYALAMEQAAVLGCDALVDGGGGDNVFCSLQSASPIADCLLDAHGRPHFWRLCDDIGRLADTSRWAVAWRAFVRARRAAEPSRWPVDLRFLRAEAQALADSAVEHPWLGEDALPWPGRAAHIAMLVAVQGYVEDGPHGAKSDAISPLASQPLIEHCLRIPSWHWFEKGRNRAAARRAFESLLPAQVAWREGKGSPASLLVRLFEINRTLLRDHLGDGLLAEARIIDRETVLRVIDDPRPAHGTGFGRILRLADAESWARGILERGA